MNSSPIRRLSAVAWTLGAGFLLVAGLALWRFADVKPPSLDPGLPADVARHFVPGEMGYEAARTEDGQQTSDVGSLPSDVTNLSSVCSRSFLTRALGGADRANDGAWARHNRLTPRLDFSHNLNRVFPPELADTHPEFFPEEAGRRIRPPAGSGWWNPDLGRDDVAAYAAGEAREYFSSKPDAVAFALGVNDGLIFGESAELLALATPVRWFRERPDYTNLVFTFMNRAAADLAQTHPDKYLGALAYYWTENAPDFPLHPQVIPFLTADRSQGYDAAFWAEEGALQARWAGVAGATRLLDKGSGLMGKGGDAGASQLSVKGSELSGDSSAAAPLLPTTNNQSANNQEPITNNSQPPRRLGLYDYTYGHGFLIPRIHTRLIAEHLREARRLGFTDYFAEMTPNWGLDGPQPWLVAQLLQDPEQSERRLLAEYYRRYFKEAAFLMERFFQRCEEQWMNQPGASYWLKHYRNESQAGVFPSAVCRELRGILAEAQQRAKTDLVRMRVQQVSDAFGVTERLVAMQEAREQLNRAALGGVAIAAPPNAERSTPNAQRRTPNVEGDAAASRLDDGRRTADGGQDGAASRGWGKRLEALRRFTEARQDFVTYVRKIQAEQPLLIAPFIMEDYLKHDPTANALVGDAGASRSSDNGSGLMEKGSGLVLLDEAAAPPTPNAQLSTHLRQGFGGQASNAEVMNETEPKIEFMELWGKLQAVAARGEELAINGSLAGPTKLERRIAGLTFGVALPDPWLSQVEPSQHHRAGLVEDMPGVLRIGGSKDTQVFQWVESGNYTFARVQAKIRGRVSVSGVAMLTLGWLDAQHRHLGTTVMRLPEGEWPEWVTLVQAGAAPAGAVWVGIGIRVQHQAKDDWVEVTELSLRATKGDLKADN